MSYQKGTHIICTLQTLSGIHQYESFRNTINTLVNEHQLHSLGEVYHNFETGGFTAVICLSESHISVHTWPEHQLVNLDIYLSNYLRTNDGVVKNIFEQLVSFFDATVIEQQTILR